MLADERLNRFIQDFARQWLQLHRLGMFPPDAKLYPKYDVWLEASMREAAGWVIASCSAASANWPV